MPTFRASDAPPRSQWGKSDGFLMMDLMLALLVMALIASLALPFVRAGGRAGLKAKAEEIAALLRSARNTALLSGQPASVTVDAGSGVIRSKNPPGIAVLPRGVTMRRTPAGLTAFTFDRFGRSSGGTLSLFAGTAGVIVRVNPFTAAVDVAEP